MSYNLKYTASFQINRKIYGAPNTNIPSYTLKIYTTDTVDEVETLLLGATPCVQEWNEDDPFAPIRGTSLKINIIAGHNKPEYADVHLSDFYTENENKFKVELIDDLGENPVFLGFLLQDDCTEILVDYAHEINLVATDNLAILKDIRLDDAATLFPEAHTGDGIILSYNESGVTTIRIVGVNLFISLQPGDKFTISNTGTGLDGTWTVSSFSPTSTPPIYTYNIEIAEYITPEVDEIGGTISYYINLSLYGYAMIKDIIGYCLRATNLCIDTKVMSSLLAVPNDSYTFNDVYLNILTFKSDSTWDTCYEVLEKIIGRFRASLFQAHGKWQIVRWGEMWRWSTNDGMNFPGVLYDCNMDVVGGTKADQTHSLAIDDFVNGWQKSIVRPYKYASERMEYRQATNTIINADMMALGNKLREYSIEVDGIPYTVKEYVPLFWYLNPNTLGDLNDFYIRVIINGNTKIEVDRYLVLDAKEAGGPFAYSNPIDIELYNIVNISWDFKTNVNNPSNTTIVWYHYISNGVGGFGYGKQLNGYGVWSDSLKGVSYYTSDGLTTDWQNVSVESNPCPRRGQMKFAISGGRIDGGETHYKNIRFEIISSNSSLKQTGQRHKSELNIVTKNNNEIDIALDDTQSNYISGTFFLDSVHDLIRDRTVFWKFDTGTEILEKPLGQLTTTEMNFWRRNTITKFSGTILNPYDLVNNMPISPISCVKIFNPAEFQDFRFVYGALSFDYKSNTVDGTLYQICNVNDTIDEFDNEYTFNYLYENN